MRGRGSSNFEYDGSYDNVRESLKVLLLGKRSVAIGISGFGSAGYPKLIPTLLAELVREEGLKTKITLLTGASAYDVDEVLGRAGLIERRYPYQFSPTMRSLINEGRVEFFDYHLGEWPSYLRSRALDSYVPKLDLAVLEAVRYDDGRIYPSMSIGAADTFANMAEKIIVEVNVDLPDDLVGIHDVYDPGLPPRREPIPLREVSDRIGREYIEVDPSKVIAVVETGGEDRGGDVGLPGSVERKMAENLLGFLQGEIDAGRLPRDVLTIESGVGALQDAIMSAIVGSGVKLRAWTEVAQDSFYKIMAAGDMEFVSATSLMLSKKGREFFFANLSDFRRRTVLRPQSVTNDHEVIRRLGVIALNTAIEVDIYGFVNSTHVLGSKLINGIGGSGDFARAAYLSVFLTPSVRREGRISCVVPMVSHVDHIDHDVDIIVTEQGVCDLRGKSPRERALTVIENCSHPDYRDGLLEYFERAVKEVGGHMPILVKEALSWHERFLKTGDMRG